MSSTHHDTAEKEDMFSYWLASFNIITSGSIKLHVSEKPALKVEPKDNRNKDKKINIDFLQP